MTTTDYTLITGASAGIGKALAKEFAANQHDLILVARRGDVLEQIATDLRSEYGVEVIVHAADLSAEGASDKLLSDLADYPVDVLINNAGVLSGGSFKNMPQQDISAMISLNIASLTAMCRSFVEPMIARGGGRILNIASVAAFQAVAGLAVYAASKAYVLNFSEALSVELASKNVTVTAVCPGYTDTEMLRGPVAKAGGAIKVPEFTVLTPERVASDAYKACMAGDAIKVPGIGYAITMATTRLIPRWLLRRISRMATGT